MKLKTIVTDDEPLARERLKLLLAQDEEIQVVAECRNGRETIARLKSAPADLLLLDIQMPGINGFDVIDAIGSHRMPPTIFVTAHNEFAIKAFSVRAVDYLTKPIEPIRLQETLAHVKKRIAGAAALLTHEQFAEALAALRTPTRNEKPYQERFIVRDGAKDVLLNVSDIEWIEAADYYSCLYVGGRKYMLRESIKELSVKLDSARFARIHRSVIVQIERVREIHHDGRAEYFVVLANGQRLRMSKTGWRNLTSAHSQQS
ncbi:LytTR family DNA-binding domain-containing protein [Tunturibacter psychrotolerans]|uniref:LytTR family DNA-binding domain-containing protein n=1 Tax=Tunturiibacter psychrotolerans TaxID=3069686 RepID=A0AAU7ZVQ4_9BACT